MQELSTTDHNRMAERLREPQRYPHAVTDVTTVRTHISTLLLTDTRAYKLKQPLNLGFLDFTTLEQRRHACDEELRLNRRLAPEIYLQRIAITGTPDDPTVGGDGPLLDWAVQMRRFDDDRLYDRLLERGELTASELDAVAAQLAAFHDQAAVADAASPWGTPAAIAEPTMDNFAQLRELLGTDRRVEHLADWTQGQLEALAPLMEERRALGRVRECHGDLHLGNIVDCNGRPVIFDGIEFSPALRWIDVSSEVAFLDMDLRSRQRPDLAARFINSYFEHTGDYPGARLLAFYRAYRALVRAKVSGLRMRNTCADAESHEHARTAMERYLGIAAAETRPDHPRLILMHGLSGSGKSTVAQALVERLGAMRLRSDVERKRLYGLDRNARTGAGVGEGLYGQQASERTYARLEELAGALLQAGMSVIVDAASLRLAERERFRDCARRAGAAFTVVDCQADVATLRARIRSRQAAGGDPSEADASVLDHQLATVEHLRADEAADTLAINTENDPALRALDPLIEGDSKAARE